MNRSRPILPLLAVFALLVLAELLLSGCSTTIAGNPVSARVGRRMPGVITQEADGDAIQHQPLDAGENGILFIVRGVF